MSSTVGNAMSVACALAWAIGVIIYKRLGEHLPPLQLALLKNLIVLTLVAGTIILLGSPAAAALGLPPLPALRMDQRSILLTLASGVIGIAIADTLYLRALNILGAGRMGVVGNAYSPFVILLSFVFLSERLSPVQILGFSGVPQAGDQLTVMDGVRATEIAQTRQRLDREKRMRIKSRRPPMMMMMMSPVKRRPHDRTVNTPGRWQPPSPARPATSPPSIRPGTWPTMARPTGAASAWVSRWPSPRWR